MEKPDVRKLFENPPAEYRGTPFWAWNCRMTAEKVDCTLKELKQMGMGGAYFHCRTGMDMEYLGPEFVEMMHYAHEKAGEEGLLTCLYDEDRWPSGFAGGLVTKEEQYRSRFLCFSPEELPLRELTLKELDLEKTHKSCAEAVSSGKRKLLAKYLVKLEKGFLAEYRRVSLTEEETGHEIPTGWAPWYAYLEVSGDNPWFNNQAYVNTLDKKAVKRFLEITYEAYYREFGDDFGKQIPMIFTDEPQFSFKTQLGYADERTRQTIPYTDDFEESYYSAYGCEFLDILPEIFWELPEGALSVNRYRYHDHVCQRFTESYADQVGAWCREHGILLTGHMMREPFLECQTMALGEAMRSYRSFGIPGIDMLCDRRELTTAKQAQSAVHQFHAPGMTSELYGVTNWDFDFRGHKLAGDWQAALGVTCRAHHLTWTSMAGEAKRDYPASIGYQSPWYREYAMIEDYFARLNTVLRRGNPEVKVGVIHPIESFWLYWGTREHTAGVREEMDERFVNLVKWLLYGLIDFDFIAESLLADFYQEEGRGGFQVGAMTYDAILVPGCVTLRRSTVNRLEEFVDRGGKVVFAGGIPGYIDARKDGAVQKLAERCMVTGFSKLEILGVLEQERILDIRDQDGKRALNLLYQMRVDGDDKWLFAAHSEKTANPDLAKEERLYVEVLGRFKVEKWNAMNGMVEQIDAVEKDGKTCWKEVSYEHDSFLYRLISDVTDLGESEGMEEKLSESRKQSIQTKLLKLPEKLPVILTEPNVLLLDRAEYSLDGSSWMGPEDLLKMDNELRTIVGYPLRTEAYAQPWVNPAREEGKHRLRLRFFITSDCEISEVSLAVEEPEKMELTWNGEQVSTKITGWYVDRDIKTVVLGKLREGRNCLEMSFSYDEAFQVENCYLLGDFGVQTAGKAVKVTQPVRELAFGDICCQGLPFYGGNFLYQIDLDADSAQRWEIQIFKFRCPLIRCRLDGKDCGAIAFSPYRLDLGLLEPGRHRLEILVYGNRVNTFGPVHNCNQTELWIGPDAWRSEGTSWADEYQLKPTGILAGPRIWLVS